MPNEPVSLDAIAKGFSEKRRIARRLLLSMSIMGSSRTPCCVWRRDTLSMPITRSNPDPRYPMPSETVTVSNAWPHSDIANRSILVIWVVILHRVALRHLEQNRIGLAALDVRQLSGPHAVAWIVIDLQHYKPR